MAGPTSAQPQWAKPLVLDADVYAEPLLCGSAVLVATENNSVYSINATTGQVEWRANLGAPIRGSTLPCGDIDPSGITGTPVIDPNTGTIYVVSFLSPFHHVLFGLQLQTGKVVSQTGVDPPGAQPQVEQQRGALALSNGVVYVPYGGLAGDCGAYHGWVVGVHTSGLGGLLAYQVPTGREGGIWAPAGITAAPNGNLYVATGNSASTTAFDYGDAVIELSPTLQVVSYFAPTNWASLNAGDTDIGSIAPTVLPNGDVFQAGKEGVGYILSGTNLGGIGGQVYGSNFCGGAYGGTARVGTSLLVPCTDGVYDLATTPTNFSIAWQSASFDAGSPIVTGGIVWVVDIGSATLLGLNLSNGQTVFSFPLGSTDHFISASATSGAVFVAGGDQLFGFTLA